MISKLSYRISPSYDPYENIATEEFLTFNTDPDEMILFLWQNARTVVIGRNQNAWKECRVTELEGSGGHLARRLSGGGAVYHDLGNLNFTFCMKKENADTVRQMQVITAAASSFGLNAQKSGRNDATVDGRKFSGNAFYDSKGCCYHHGTLLISVSSSDLARYLSPSKAKLESKGVESVRSRVVNLSDLNPAITPDTMKDAMIRSFEGTYGLKAEEFKDSRIDKEAVEASRRRFSSWEWKYGQKIPFTDRIERRFGWGEIELVFKVTSGVIDAACLSSDCLNASWFEYIGNYLKGCRYDAPSICLALKREMETRGVPESAQEDLIRFVHESI